MKDLTIGQRIIGGFTIIILLTFVLAAVLVISSGKVVKGSADLKKVHVPLSVGVGQLLNLSNKQNSAALLYAMHKEERYSQEQKSLENEIDQLFNKFKAIIATDPELVSGGWEKLIDQTAMAHDTFSKAAEELISAARSSDQSAIERAADHLEETYRKFDTELLAFVNTNTNETNKVLEASSSTSSTAETIAKIFGIITLLSGSVLAFFITRSINRKLTITVREITDGAAQVAAASSQVAAGSTSLADNTTGLAAFLEEASSSMEEMSSMTKQNADNSHQVDSLMRETNQIISQATDSMSQLTDSMGKISKASEETSKIVKTIDEIAFQTNLLALNAAVEAARSGEAGAGFAVVADEVRNLAMRAAEAAKNTAGLIEGTVQRVREGSDLVTKTDHAFTQVSESTGKVASLVAEISVASQEQSQGIAQINQALTRIDSSVQQNSAHAEESASASEELNAQAEQMRESALVMARLVGGQADAGPAVGSSLPRRTAPAVKNPIRAKSPIPLAAPKKTSSARSVTPKTPAKKLTNPRPAPATSLMQAAKQRPEDVIPFDDDDKGSFADF
ncbi:MAG: hypothetical protein A2511_16515 [Deltaproteobacteria bacterium RIFOXYD12_FULL_50_9]|nr:MAG: hypothetical protein A2511_16515 [Deltaproteobacteria bacterium RIFOXYD12_FULL_50_9]